MPFGLEPKTSILRPSWPTLVDATRVHVPTRSLAVWAVAVFQTTIPKHIVIAASKITLFMVFFPLDVFTRILTSHTCAEFTDAVTNRETESLPARRRHDTLLLAMA